jgi:hypothetical protein
MFTYSRRYNLKRFIVKIHKQIVCSDRLHTDTEAIDSIEIVSYHLKPTQVRERRESGW